MECSRKVNKVSHGKIKEVKKLKKQGFASIKAKIGVGNGSPRPPGSTPGPARPEDLKI